MQNAATAIDENFEEIKAEMSLSFNEQLWKGMEFPQASNSIVLPKTLEQCRNGYLIIWAPFINNAVVDDILVYQFVSKVVLTGKIFVFTGHNYNKGEDFVKRLTIASDRKTIVGNDSNKGGANYNFMMREIRSW